ncbi:hypothetical protein DM02DRAFT_611765 [Periconia macrospinosa]|uniref:Uncharacterized protein n=1 Tax=Periconia macrospinosa TaxID=97972 RepID=A0A2V1E4L3_9PLEO|nr:hypothetical protein DM02DRAFT_611765 [Periconia macrospinosa]
MASRSNSAIYDDVFDPDSAESSPDPLSRSINENTPYARRTATRTTKQPLVSSSPSKQNRRQRTSDFEISSPSKSMVLNTPRGTGASPWRIKVTVQAEPDVGDENASSPTVQHVTRTTTVPLKDADASSPVKRRGRPRKSDASSAKPKRNGTPVRKTPKSPSKSRDITSESSIVDENTTSIPKKRRGRPRKSLLPSEEETLDQISQDLNFTTISMPEEDSSPKKKRGRPRKSLQPSTHPDDISAAVDTEADKSASTPTPAQMAIPVIETTVPTPQSRQKDPTDKAVYPPGFGILGLADYELEERMHFTPPQTELSQRIRARKNTPAAKGKVLIEISSDEDSDDQSDINTPSGSDEDAPAGNASQEHSTSYHVSQEDDTAPTAAPETNDPDGYDELQDVTEFAFGEGITRGPDDTTIVESENFSMISVDSLPSSGGLTSPACAPSGQTPATSHAAVQNHDYLKISSADTQSSDHIAVSSSASTHLAVPAASRDPSPHPPLSRHKTPVMDETTPSNPPPIEAFRPSPFEAETPKIGRVVKAGVALQGVLDPSRVTPEAGPSKAAERLSELDDLFRGFSDRTRKELRAGLRLGEQLAKENASNKGSPSTSRSPLKGKAATRLDPPQTKEHHSRLLTPEGHEHGSQVPPVDAVPQSSEVQYPTLSATDSHLPTPSISPARSEDEMSWKVDTPPVNAAAATNGRLLTASNEHGEVLRGTNLLVEADEDVDMDDGDVWVDEAVQSSKAASLDPFVQDGPVKPARAKLPKTWRRKSSNNFNYSDESEEAAEAKPPLADKGKDKATAVEAHDQFDEGSSDASDDTGMFFQRPLPNNRSKRSAEKLDLSLLMNEGESLLPDSSPPVAKSNAPSARKANPFLEAPPRLAAFPSSPIRSSPLRNEIRGSSSEHSQVAFEESTLPLAPSSPFHTIVDDTFTGPSDQRQLYDEMNNMTDSSLRNIRTEADGYVEAYDLRDRTLGDITEVTEPSRSFVTRRTTARSSPQKKAFEESMVKPKERYAPLFDNQTEKTPARSAAQPAPSKRTSKKQRTPEPSQERIATAPRAEEPTQPSAGLFSRIGSTLWGAFGSTAPAAPEAPPLHPILDNIDHLPKVEPWTKTHYKTLDRLYQTHLKKPSLLTPHHSSPNSDLNASLLQNFLDRTGLPFVGATYSVWGYSITLDEGLVVLCAVYMQLLSLSDIAEYEAKSGKSIQMGECAPREAGIVIDDEEVMKRLATVIIGDELRKDEKKGIKIVRKGTLQVEWPET